MDRITKEQRSHNMSQVKSKNTKPEILLFSILKKSGFRFTRHSKTIQGKPDAVLKGIRVAIFVDGEFWHGKKFREWKDGLTPFWLKKISENINRDKKVNQILSEKGYTVIRFWGKEITKKPGLVLNKIKKYKNFSK